MVKKVKVYSNQNVALVGSLQNYLLQHDIRAEIRNQFTSGVMGEAAFFDAWPELWVFENDYVQAEEILEQFIRQPTSPNGPDWLCQRCRESNPANFEICWQCNQAN